jgi:hypothetical protein
MPEQVRYERPRPKGTVPCSRCGLLVSADDGDIREWSATGGVLTYARHDRDGCIRAMGRRINALEGTWRHDNV